MFILSVCGGPATLLEPVVARPRRERCGQFARLPGRRGRARGVCGEAMPPHTPPPR